MPVRFPWYCGASLSVVALGAAVYLLAAGPARPGPVGGRPESALGREQRRARRQEVERERMRQRRRQRAALLAATAAGRVPLFEAAARLRELELEAVPAEHYDRMLRWIFPGRSTAERLCRKVIQGIRDGTCGPYTAAEAAARLERELAEHLEHRGTVRLPEVRDE
jgi:hypothetical protein